MPNPVLSSSNPVSGEMFPVPSRMRMAFSDDNVQYLEWHYFVHADGKNGNRRITRVGRKFKVGTMINESGKGVAMFLIHLHITSD